MGIVSTRSRDATRPRPHRRGAQSSHGIPPPVDLEVFLARAELFLDLAGGVRLEPGGIRRPLREEVER